MAKPISVTDLDMTQLMHLAQFVQIKNEKGVDAAVAWAEEIIAEAEGTKKAQTPEHLSLVR